MLGLPPPVPLLRTVGTDDQRNGRFISGQGEVRKRRHAISTSSHQCEDLVIDLETIESALALSNLCLPGSQPLLSSKKSSIGVLSARHALRLPRFRFVAIIA